MFRKRISILIAAAALARAPFGFGLVSVDSKVMAKVSRAHVRIS